MGNINKTNKTNNSSEVDSNSVGYDCNLKSSENKLVGVTKRRYVKPEIKEVADTGHIAALTPTVSPSISP